MTSTPAAQEIEKSGNLQKCPACGFSQADFKKTGRLGCPLCYDTFSDGLNSLLKAMHKGTSHTGKMPARMQQHIQHDAELEGLQKELEKAVLEENYESAADLRDQIKHLENKPEMNQ